MVQDTERDGHREKVKIVYVIDNFYRGGGTENQLALLIDHMDRRKFTPYVFNLRPRWDDYSIEIDCDVFYLDVDSLISIKAFKAVFKIARFLRKNKIDILQVYFMDSRAIGTIAGKLAGIKRLVFCRRDFGWWHTPRKLKMVRFLAKMANYCLVNARTVKDLVARTEMFPAERIEVIYNGVILQPPNGQGMRSRRDFGIPEDVPVIGLVANLRPVKRVDRLLSAVSMMQNKKVHVLITGFGELLEELESQAQSLGISDRVHFHHVIGVYHVLKICDIGALTSESEGLSNVLIEYALSGLPTVAFDIGGNSEVVIDNETGFVVPDGDIKTLAAKFDRLLENDDLRQSMGEKARKLATDKFDVVKMTRRTEEFYGRIMQA